MKRRYATNSEKGRVELASIDMLVAACCKLREIAEVPASRATTQKLLFPLRCAGCYAIRGEEISKCETTKQGLFVTSDLLRNTL